MPAMVAERFVIGSVWRALLGLALWLVAIGILSHAHGLEFGIGWTALVPALVLTLPATALLRRRVLRLRQVDGQYRLSIDDGWLWRRAMELPLGDSELELLPTAGLRAVVLHRRGGSVAVATWIGAGRAHRLIGWLESAVGPMPRRTPSLPVNDR